VDADDVLVSQVEEAARLLPQVVARVAVENDLLGDALERDGPPERLVLSEEHLPHAPLAHEADNAEPLRDQSALAEAGSGVEGSRGQGVLATQGITPPDRRWGRA
jgi:hypothetical protein